MKGKYEVGKAYKVTIQEVIYGEGLPALHRQEHNLIWIPRFRVGVIETTIRIKKKAEVDNKLYYSIFFNKVKNPYLGSAYLSIFGNPHYERVFNDIEESALDKLNPQEITT